ncbi:IS66 family transposase [Anaeroplasma bactoclasticum]|uniref:IS66 family transposase n=1 Tax=Anaeroplasma bactoclasticum TaxID=2088 RepID=UPI003CCC83B8
MKEKRNTNEYQKFVDYLHDDICDIKAQPGSLLEKAINYAKNSWDELFTYREYGYLEISNNIAERSVKPFVIARKNFLFSKTENGAQASGLLFSIIQTAKANGLCIERYLEYALSNINKLQIDDILPWSKNLPKELKLNL